MVEIVCELCQSVLVVDEDGNIENICCSYSECPYDTDFLDYELGKELNFNEE